MDQSRNRMLQGPVLPAVIRYTVPIILTSLLQLLFNAADLVVVGRFCGSVSVAAVGATGAVTNLIVNLFIGLSVGAGVTVAHGLGGSEDQVVHRTVHTAIPAAFLGGVVLTVVGIFAAEPLLVLMDTPENVLPLSAVYMRIYFGGMVFTMLYNFAAAILRAAGDTRSPLIFLTIAGVINVGLNVIFVTGLHMNVAGVALATAISQAVSAAAVLIVLMRRKDACKLELKKLRFYKPQLMKMLRIGLPAGIQGSLFSISNVMIQSSINSFGDVVMSGNAAAGNIGGFVYATMNAFQQTAVNFIGQNVGAGQYKRVKQVMIACLASVAVVGFAAGLAVNAFGPQLLSIYITDSPESITWGVIYFGIVLLPYFLFGMMDVSAGALRGMGASLLPMCISLLGVCGLRVLWVIVLFPLEQFHSPQGLYVSYPVSWAITLSVQAAALVHVYRRQSAMMARAEERG